MEEYAVAAAGFRKFYFALSLTAELHDPSNTIDDIESIDTKDIVSDGASRLFGLGKALNVPRGAPGHLFTAFGSLTSAVDKWNAAVLAEEKATCAAAQIKPQMDTKAEAEAREKNMASVLVECGYMKTGDRLTKKILFLMFSEDTVFMVELKVTLFHQERLFSIVN